MIRSLRPASALVASVALTLAGVSAASPSYAAVPKPAVGALSVHAGVLVGGTKVTVTGKNFTKVKAVKFGTVAGSHLKVVSATKLTVISPRHAAGVVDLHVITGAGTSPTVKADHFRYIAAPKVTKVAPYFGNTAGGIRVTLSGANFFGVKKVLFGGTPATGVKANAAGTVLSVLDPVHVPGSVHVRVYTAFGSSAVVATDAFTYVATPTVSSIAPATGPTAGGTSVTVTGSGFDSSSQVAFGSALGTNVAVSSPTSLTVTAPPGGPGAVDVVVSAAGGLSPTTGADHFTYVAPPSVSSISPATGPTAGGTSVSVTGTNFTTASSVTFGGSAASGVTVNSPTSLTATAPAGAAGAADVTVSTIGGTSPTSSADQFTYVAAPTVSALSPATGPVAGGTSVTITGTNFTASTTVKFGTAAASVTVNSSTQLTATSPAGAAGPVTVTVTTVGGSVAAGTQFTYVASSTGGSVSGAVTDASTHAGLGGVNVFVYTLPSGSYASPIGSATTAANGTYSIDGVPVASNDVVCFDASHIGGTYSSQCSNNVPWYGTTPVPSDAAQVAITANATATVNAGLSHPGSITGTVTDAGAASTHLAGVDVYVYDLASGQYGTPIGHATTAANGTYTVAGVAPGSGVYEVCFDGSAATGGVAANGYASQCNHNVPWPGYGSVPSAGTPVSVAAGVATTVDAGLARNGAISGTVHDAVTGSVQDATVYVFDLASGQIGTPVGQATTDASGGYSVTGVPASSSGYAVCVNAPQGTGASTTGYLGECYQSSSWSGGQPATAPNAVAVTADQTTSGVNVSLAHAAAISGTVTDSTTLLNNGIGDATVYVYELANGQIGTAVGQATTTSNGAYSVKGLSASASGYAVCVDAQGSTGPSNLGYQDKCYNGIAWSGPGTAPGVSPTALPVAQNATANANFALQPDGGISGTVTADVANAADNVNVVAYDPSGNQVAWANPSSGSYTLTGLTPGVAYHVCFDASGTPYASQCYNNAAWPDSSVQTGQTVTVNSGAITTGINAAFVSSSISGTVTASDTSAGLQNVDVQVYDQFGGWVADQYTAADGTYTVHGLTPGVPYDVCFATFNGYASQCYNGVPWSGGGLPTGMTQVTISGATRTGVNAVLAPNGSISGHATASAGGAAVANVVVQAFDPSGVQMISTATAGDGSYSLSDVSPGVQYTICFDATSSGAGASGTGYLSQCYNGVAWGGGYSPAPGATAVSVTSGADHSGVDAHLATAGAVSGKATNLGTAVANVRVILIHGGHWVSNVYTAADGTYKLTGLDPAQSYDVCFIPPSTTTYSSQCYQGQAWSRGQPIPAGATALTVPAGTTTANVNASLS